MSAEASPQGLLVVLVTALDEKRRTDRKGQRAVARAGASAGDALVVGGSVGEGAYLPDEELVAAVESSVEGGGGRPVWAGILRSGTVAAKKLARACAAAGATGLLVGLPQTFGIPLEQEKDHLRRVRDAADRPLLYYHYPDTFHAERRPEELVEILSLPGVVGLKDTTMPLATVRKRLKVVSGHGSYFPGSTLLWPEALEAGAAGAICPIPLLEPSIWNLLPAFHRGDPVEVRATRKRLTWTLPILSGKGLPAAIQDRGLRAAGKLGLTVSAAGSPIARIKEALGLLGLPISSRVSPPLPPLSEAEASLVHRAVQQSGRI